jgi:hypothetical protein
MRRGFRARPGGAAVTVRASLRAGLIAVVWLLLLGADVRAASNLEPFFGSYVGVATVEDTKTGETGQRDMDIVIQPYRDGGFRIDWINVTLVDGRRDLPGVERRVQSALFEPVEDRDMYVEVEAKNPFREREETQPMRGDPVRWASIDGPRLHVYAFMVLEDGTYELQIYDRVLTDKGIDIAFQRIVDGEVVRRISGTTARAQE